MDTFLIISDYTSGRYVEETECGYSRAQAIHDICDGQHEQAVQVWCVNPVEGTFENVSAEIAEACLREIMRKHWPGDDPYIPSIVEEYCTPGLNDWQSELQEAVGG